jgi:uncharacterized protein YciI
MKVIKGLPLYLAQGRQMETSGDLRAAASNYEKVVERDPSNAEAVARLLIIYRKQKEYRKELTVIDNAIGAYSEKEKTIREKWLRDHPQAAGAGKAVLRSLGGGAVSAFGTDPMLKRLLKRRELVERKAGGGTAKHRPARPSKGGSAGKTRAAGESARKKNQREAAEQRQQEKAEREAAAAARREAAEYRRQQEKEQKKAAAEARKRATAEARKAAAAEAKSHPSLFVISLRYLVPLEQIDAEMPRHAAFLDKYYKSGHILVSGRQVPRTGGVIIARARDRGAAERMIEQDPFVRKKLASADIVEFSASRVGEGLRIF